MNEFSIIEKYFAPLCPRGIKDDAAILSVPDGHELIVTTDTLNAGTHFMDNAAPADIAHKALRVNLSDLAAMGAEPYAYQLAIAFPEKPTEDWLAAFTAALLTNQKEFGIFCSGGDTTSIKGPLSISITAMGTVPKGKAVTRAGAKPGDLILLAGPVGEAFIGLKILQGELETPHAAQFIERYYRPVPRLDLAAALREHANAAIDVSDGLLADLGHICAASNVGAEIHLEKIPFSPQTRALDFTPEDLLSGGDDYALLIAVSPENLKHFKTLPVIGECITGQGVTLRDTNGKIRPVNHTGWSHF